MAGLVVASDPIEFAKELALEFELAGNYDEDIIYGTLHAMNTCLQAAGYDGRSIVMADEAYTLPDDDIDIEFMTDTEVEQLRIAAVAVKGNIREIKWFGSVSMTAFGIRMYGVDFYQPERQVSDTLFIPVENIALRIAA